MHRFKNILFVATPGSGVDAALRRAVDLAVVNKGRLTIVQIAALEPDALTGDLGRQVDGLIGEIEQEQSNELARLKDAVEDLGIRPDTRLLRGKPFLSIVQQVLRSDHDLVMKKAEGSLGGFKARLFGSTDQHLMRKCPAPVWLFKDNAGAGFRSVLAAVDVGQTGNEELNTRILQLASSLASREGSELHVVHAWALYGETMLRSPSRGVGKEILAKLLSDEEAERRRRLEAAVNTAVLPGIEAELHLLKAEAAEGVEKAAESVEADLVVMGTLSRAGVRGLLIGNTAETVLSRMDSSVLTVKPDGFQTPISLDADG